jgi:FAD/FMN-containing dehydrogenase
MTTAAAMRASLARSFTGELIGPGDEGYDTARRVENAYVDRRPALIAKARDTADVSAAVRWARDAGVHLSVAAGRHGFSGDAVNDGGLVLDVSLLRGIAIDARARTVQAGAGLTAGELTTAVYAEGFAIPFGDTGSVGIAGITLGGGIGWLVRRYGATVDQLRSVEIVTADGLVRTASPQVEPDLFWALTGGGGNFGVATAFEYALNPIGRVSHGSIVLPATREILEALVPLGLAAPEELTIMPLVGRISPRPEVAEDLVGTVAVYVELVYSGPEADAVRALAPFRSLGPVILDTVAVKPYPDVYPPGGTDPWGMASEALFIDDLDDEIAEVLVRLIGAASAAEALVQLRVFGGAFARSPDGATALGQRSRRALLWLLTPYEDLENGADYHAWTRSLRDELASKSRGTYLNFLETPDAAAIAAAYAPETLARLASIKRTYDPSNLFHPAANIEPATSERSERS